MKKATHQQTKEHNRNLVLKTIYEHESISRAEIARVTSLTRTTVSDIVTDLLEERLVSEVGMGLSTGGKMPILLSLEEDSRWLIGLDLALNQFRGAVVNLRGKIREMVTLPLNDRDGDEALAMVYQMVDELMARANRPLAGIGVGTAGLVNTNEGVVLNAVNLNWRNLPLTRLLQERYHLPVYVLNDSQAAAIGEYTYGSRGEGLADRRRPDHLVVINAGHGLGAGIIINGKLFQGDGGSAGEIGHTVVVPENGLACRCGKHGCLETVASAQALIRRLRASQAPAGEELTRQDLTLEAVEKAFRAGDAQTRSAVLDTARYIGMAISNLVGVLNIQEIVLTGAMTCFGEPWTKAIQETVCSLSLPGPAQNTRLETGQLGGNGIILGASAMIANDYSLLFRRPYAPD